MAKRNPRTSGAERAFQIIECLVGYGEPATAYQIAKLLRAPLSTIYDSIGLLEKLEVLSHKGPDGKYFLGPRLLFYGLAYTRGIEADAVYRHEAEALSRLSGENVQICVRDGDYMVVAAMVDGSDQFHISSRPGSRTPLNWSASGRLLLGHLTPAGRAEIFARALPSPTGRAETDPARLEAICASCWERGYSIQIAESDFAVACIAAPIINPAGECMATVSLVVPEARAETSGEELARMVIASARNIEKSLGWSRVLRRRAVDVG